MSKPLSTFSGSTLYLDAMVFYLFLRDPESATRTLFAQIAAGDVEAYTSVLSFDELTYRMLLAVIRDTYGGSPLEHLRARETEIIAEFYPILSPHLARLRTFPHLTLVEITPADLETMSQAIHEYHLRPRDALHMAAMLKCRCFDMVSHDTDFDRVPTVQRFTLSLP